MSHTNSLKPIGETLVLKKDQNRNVLSHPNHRKNNCSTHNKVNKSARACPFLESKQKIGCTKILVQSPLSFKSAQTNTEVKKKQK